MSGTETQTKWTDATRILSRTMLSAQIKELRAGLSGLAKQAKDEDERFELTRYVDKCTGLLQDLEAFLPQTKQDYVYWVEVSENTEREAVYLKSAPLNVGADVKRSLFDKFDSVIMTSATLSSGEDKAHHEQAEKGERADLSFSRAGLVWGIMTR